MSQHNKECRMCGDENVVALNLCPPCYQWERYHRAQSSKEWTAYIERVELANSRIDADMATKNTQRMKRRRSAA